MAGSLVYATGDRYGPPSGLAEAGSGVYDTGFRYGPPTWPGGRRHATGTIVLAPGLPAALAPRVQMTLQRVLERLDEELTPGRRSAAIARAQVVPAPGATFIDPLSGITVFLEDPDHLVVGVPERPTAVLRFDGKRFLEVPRDEWVLQLTGAEARLQQLTRTPGARAQPATATTGGAPWGLLGAAAIGFGAAYWYTHR